MALPVLVVDGDAAVEEGGEGGGIQRFLDGDREQGLGLVEEEAAVAVGGGDQGLARFGGEGEGAARLRLGAVEELRQSVAIEAVEGQDLRAA